MVIPGARVKESLADITGKAEKVLADVKSILAGIAVVAVAALVISVIALIKTKAFTRA